MTEVLSQEEINERVAVLKRFRKLLEEKRAKFQEYLLLLEKQEKGITNNDDTAVLAHAELETQIVSNIENLQKVINPIEDMYEKIGSPVSAEIPQLKEDLEKLQTEVLAQNEKNRELLKLHMDQLKEQLKNMHNPKINPYANRRNVYAQNRNTANILDVEG
ncbi:MAG: flagellar biosynthesis protein FlgN [Treponemataceae bacterium]|nr:flagellar biosynthesis protein FlgN [Treponemataceae bacterium]